eukprot:sb/3476808/
MDPSQVQYVAFITLFHTHMFSSRSTGQSRTATGRWKISSNTKKKKITINYAVIPQRHYCSKALSYATKKAKVILIVIGALGGVSPRLEKYLQKALRSNRIRAREGKRENDGILP